jgi:acetylornithine deacetylase
VDPIDVVALTRTLVDCDSTTGREGDVTDIVAALLGGRGWDVVEQPLDGRRRNLLARVGASPVVLSTHLDCVPPFFPSRLEGAVLFGRGACDAKGIAAAQIAAAERLRADGTPVGLLFVAGEERGSDGARAAASLAYGSRYLVDGEPTDSRMAVATRGVWRVRLHAAGRAAHSSTPHLGESAIEKLVDALVALRGLELPADADLGRTTYSVGLIEGGVAPNVVPPHAMAEIVFRTIGDVAPLARAVAPLARLARVEEVLVIPPVRMLTVEGFDTAVFPFTTDVPLLGAWGAPALFGPGSIAVAHTDEEHVRVEELTAAVGAYVRIARALMAGESRG